MKNSREYMADLANSSDILYELSEFEQRTLKQVLLEMYLDIEKFCEENNITVMLGGGSALGAIRHKGFIPWDDDLDLLMSRTDYNKFIKNFETELGDKYYLCAPNAQHQSRTCFAKVIKKDTKFREIFDVNSPHHTGVFIDIFPIEFVPDSKNLQKIKGFFMNSISYISFSVYLFKYKNEVIYKYMSQSKGSRENYQFRLLIGCVFSFMPHTKWCKLFDKLVTSKNTNKYCGIPTGRKHYNGEILEKEVYFPASKAEFEGLQVNVPNDVDTYLKNLYGDYLKIPPVEKRERHYVVEFDITPRKGE
ncbi:LicD family protein [Schinkia azotoformans]|uniref:LicD family protein n=1 Tax=Schinkia azotoformans TaxID=1454 RepID=UPI002DBC5DF9|nr:LicD family protein [Schinkia azotoformans]MEC1771906.1 LicD family protein [Schinkia azotoformans]MED4366404.1 LicD family protein [Schinkia azotoformans]